MIRVSCYNYYYLMDFPALLFPKYPLRLRETAGKSYVFDEIRKKYVVLTPEEWVRQHLLHYFMHELLYPRSIIGVEMVVMLQGMPKRCDVAVWNQHRQAVLLAECKAAHIALNKAVFEQTARYNLRLQVRYCVVTNGKQLYCYRLNYESSSYTFLDRLPTRTELLNS